LDNGKTDKTDPNNARSAAIAAWRNQRLNAVSADDHRAVLLLLANRYHNLTAGRTQNGLPAARRCACC
jgi:hypothetical protein